MNFSKHNENSIPQLVELKCELGAIEGDDQKYSLRAELSFYPDEIDTEDDLVKISIKTAYLVMQCQGLEPVLGSKIGAKLIPHQEIKIKKVEKTLTTGVEQSVAEKVAASGSFEVAKIKGEIKSEHSSGVKEKSEIKVKENQEVIERSNYVQAIGADRWVIRGGESGYLDGTYLNSDTICSLRRDDRLSNRVCVEASVQVRQRDLDFKFTNKRLGWGNHGKVYKALLAKSLHPPYGRESYKGIIVFSTSECVCDD